MLSSRSSATAEQEEAFCHVYHSYYPQVFRYLRRRTDEQSAMDATAETFLVAWRRRNDMPAGTSCLPWLYGVARRVLSNQRRGERRRKALTLKVAATARRSEPSIEERVVPEDHIQAVLQAMARLRPDDREVLRLAEWEGLSHAEIGVAMGCSTHAVDQRMYRAMRRLASELPSDWSAPDRIQKEGSP